MGKMNGLKDSLLTKEDKSLVNDPLLQKTVEGPHVTKFATSGALGKIFFTWLNPVLKIGSRKSLEPDDIPQLAPGDRAEVLYERFSSQWQKLHSQGELNTVRKALISAFWWPILGTALLGVIRLSVLYVGPVLIQSFIVVTSGNERFPNERFAIVAILLVAKVIEASANHQYNFSCAKLGMQIRSAIITVVYRKSLKLSSAAREIQGAGKIVNLMSVDAQVFSDAMVYLNNIWLLPLQIFLAGAVVYPSVGTASLAGLVVMIIAAGISYSTMAMCQKFQMQMMIARDSRLKATMEALSNMKIIKLQAWDDKFSTNIAAARGAEFRELRKFTIGLSVTTFTSWFAPVCACVATFFCTVLMGRGLSPSAAFTTVSVIRTFQELLRLFPNLMFSLAQLRVSLDRLEKYMLSEELDDDAVVMLTYGTDSAVICENGSFKWDMDSERPVLQDINIDIKRGSFVAVVGKVGSGKTSLLSSLQGEMPKIAGTVKSSGRTACVTQSAWIQNATIRENILFGAPMDQERYAATLLKCALELDLAQMDNGDQTEIGERGVNLSGGQKQRIQLARAIYQDCDLYFLDDIFSAVDAHTGTHLFKECVLGALADKTVVLVTHQVEFLPRADLILVMRDGRITQSGKYEDLLAEGSDLEALVHAHNEALEKVEGTGKQVSDDGQSFIVGHEDSENFTRSSSKRSAEAGAPEDEVQNSDEDGSENVRKSGEGGGRLIEDELKESGSVGFRVYWVYLTRIYGGALVFAMIILMITAQGFQISSDYWVAFQSNYNEKDTAQASHFIYVYSLLAVITAVFMATRPIGVAIVGLMTCQSFFMGLLKSIFRAPMSFFDTTPNGRILSRATTDLAVIDFMIPQILGAALATFMTIFGAVVVACSVIWQIVLMLLPVAFAFRSYQMYYFSSSRELTRLDGLMKAPIINHFSETVAGFSTIRCFHQQHRFIVTNLQRVDSSLRMDFHNNAAMEWVGMRLELIGVTFLVSLSLALVTVPQDVVAPELGGLALTYALMLNSILFGLVWMTCTLENKMIAVERLRQYTNLPAEAELTIEETKPDPTWPSVGTIVFQNLKLRYRSNTPLVLKGINLTIEGGQKVGVVGRTGSGKSTLILALFRLVEAAGGRIYIDGIAIETLGLKDLRSKLSIIPQDPSLFDGTVRSNIDPLGEHSDDEIWGTLEKCQLASSVRQLEGKLDALVTANGENWSVGQRQLFSLGRVLLRKTRILFMDEATSSVDTQTDAVMQKIVRQDFADCTVISIAHRIPSVMDSDRVIVLEGGIVKEFDSPAALLDRPNSLFSSLVAEYSARSATS